jgi:hypothetical protein
MSLMLGVVNWRLKMLSPKLVFAVLVAALIAVGFARSAHALDVEVRVAAGTVAPADTAARCDTLVADNTAPFSVQLTAATNTLNCTGFDITALMGAVDNGSTKTLTATGITIDNNGGATRSFSIKMSHTFSVTDNNATLAGVQTTGGLLFTGYFKRNGVSSTLASGSTTTLRYEGTCLPGGQAATFPGPNGTKVTSFTATKTVPSTGVALTQNRISLGNSQTPIECPNNTTSMTLRVKITGALQLGTSNGDNITSTSTVGAAIGDQGAVNAFLAGHFVRVELTPNDFFDPSSSGKQLATLYAEPDFVTIPGGNVEFRIIHPWQTIVEGATFLAGAAMFGNAAKSGDNAKMQFEFNEMDPVYTQCGVESLPFQSIVDICVITCGTKKEQGVDVLDCSTATEVCGPQEVSVDIPVVTDPCP